MLNLAHPSDEIVDNEEFKGLFVEDKPEETINKGEIKYKKPAFEVPHPECTYITVDKALEYCGDNSTYSKRCLIILVVLWSVNSFLTMGWPLYFEGNTYLCKTADGRYENCDLKTACKTEDPSEIIIQGRSTITKEFRLICGAGTWVPFASTIFFTGMLISGVVVPILGDSRGRRLSLLCSIFITTASVISLGFSPNIIVACCFFLGAGIGFSGIEIVSLVYSTEISGKRFRNHSMTILQIFWAISQVLLGFIFRFVDYWRYIFIAAIGVPCLLCFIAGWYILDETPSYLVSHGQTDAAKKVLCKMADTNRRPPFQFKLMKEIEVDNEKFFYIKKTAETEARNSHGNPLKSMTSHTKSKGPEIKAGVSLQTKIVFGPGLRVQSLIMTFLWYTRFFAYYGLQFNIEEIGREILLNFTMMGIAEILASLASVPIKRKYTRKTSMQVCLGVCAVSCFISQWFTVPVVIALTTKFSITLFYNILVTYSGEIYPTETRTQAYGLFMTVGRLAVITMPTVVGLWTYFTPFLSTHLIGGFLVISMLLLHFLKETLDAEMVENYERGRLSSSHHSQNGDPRRVPLLRDD